MSTIIKPTPGRVVWYWPSQQEIDAKAIAYFDQTQPLAATVAYAWPDSTLVNLSVTDQAGTQFRRTSVQLIQDGQDRPHTSQQPFAEWMPYQKGQTAKTDATPNVGSVLGGADQEPVLKWLAERGIAPDKLPAGVVDTLATQMSGVAVPEDELSAAFAAVRKVTQENLAVAGYDPATVQAAVQTAVQAADGVNLGGHVRVDIGADGQATQVTAVDPAAAPAAKKTTGKGKKAGVA